MIARVWHGVSAASRSDRFHEYMTRTGVKDCRETVGNRGVLVLKRTKEDRVHFLFVSLWESYDAIKRFAGDDIGKAVYYPEDESFLLELEPAVTHYDVFASLPSGGVGHDFQL